MRKNEKCGKTRKAEKREMRKNEGGEHAGNRSGESAVARESKRNDWTDKHMEGWLRNG